MRLAAVLIPFAWCCGCVGQAPFPESFTRVDCVEREEQRHVRFVDEVSFGEGGSFKVRSGKRTGSYASCHDFCRNEETVVEVKSCALPIEVDEPLSSWSPNQPSERHWRVRCNVVAVACEGGTL